MDPFLESLRRDAARYADLGGWYAHPGFWIVAVYRLGVWSHALPSRSLRVPVRAIYRLLSLPLRLLFNVDLWGSRGGTKIGAGLCLVHPRNVVVGAGVEIGRECLIFHEVTLGKGPAPGFPKIGDRVDIYVGARVLGGVAIGDDCIIGANCVVTRDVPARSVVVAAANHVISRALSPTAGGVDRTLRSDADGASKDAIASLTQLTER